MKHIEKEISRKLNLFESDIKQLSQEQHLILNKLQRKFAETNAEYSTRHIRRLTKELHNISLKIEQLTGLKSQLISILTKL